MSNQDTCVPRYICQNGYSLIRQLVQRESNRELICGIIIVADFCYYLSVDPGEPSENQCHRYQYYNKY